MATMVKLVVLTCRGTLQASIGIAILDCNALIIMVALDPTNLATIDVILKRRVDPSNFVVKIKSYNVEACSVHLSLYSTSFYWYSQT